MKKYTHTLLALLLAGTLIGCNSSNDTEAKNEANTTTPVVSPTPQAQTEKQKMPTCYIKKGTPLTDSMITVHVRCKNGNIPIDEAIVTLDGTVKDVAYKGVYFSDYIGFRNLQPDTSYKATLEVFVGGKTIKKSVKIRTREEKVLATPTPTPIVHSAPVWRKKVYELYKGIEDPDNKINLNLDQEVFSKEGNKITYKIISNSYKIVDDSTCLQDHPFSESKSIQIDANNLIVKYTPPCVGIITSVIQAKSAGGVSSATVKINFEPTPFMPIGNSPSIWTKKVYYKEIEEKDFNPNALILNLEKISEDKEGNRIKYSIENVDLSKYNLYASQCPQLPYPYRPKKGFFIENNTLNALSSEFDPCRYGIIAVTIGAKTNNGFSTMNVEITFISDFQ